MQHGGFGLVGQRFVEALDVGLLAEAFDVFLHDVLLLLGIENVADAGLGLVEIGGLGVLVFRHLDEVEAKLGFDDFADRADGLREGGVFEFRHHLAAAEGAEVAAGAGAGAVGVGLGQFREIGAFEDLLAEVFEAGALGGLGGIVVGGIHLDQDVGGGDGFALGEAFLVFVVELLDFLVGGLGDGLGLGHDHLADGHLLAHFGLGGARFGHVGLKGSAGRQLGGEFGLDLGEFGVGEADALLGDFAQHDLAHHELFDDAFAQTGQRGLELLGRHARAHLLAEHADHLLDFACGDVRAVDLGDDDGGFFRGQGGGFRRGRGGFRGSFIGGREGQFHRRGRFGDRRGFRGDGFGGGGGFRGGLGLASGHGPGQSQGGQRPNGHFFHGIILWVMGRRGPAGKGAAIDRRAS